MIEETACEKGCAKVNDEVLGVRIYFGTYPDHSQFSDLGIGSNAVPDNNEFHHTLMLVPTWYDQANNRDIDFDPLHWGHVRYLSAAATLGELAVRVASDADVLAKYNDGKEYCLHFATAREMVNIIHAAENGHAGDAGQFRD